jgi:3-carboxy-cis,cis-muconate cycloisomerase
MSKLRGALAGDPEIEALLSDEAQLEAILRFEVALAQSEAEAGLIDAVAAQEIARAVEQFTPDWPGLLTGMARDGVVVPALLSQLRAALPATSQAALHWGATSQDAIDAALVLQLVAILPVLQGRIDAIRTQLASLAEQHGATTLMAHTRMQAALPFTVADKLGKWDEALARHRAAIAALSPDLLVVQLGGPIGNRSSFFGHGDHVAEVLASRLGLGAAPCWHTVRDRLVGLGARVTMLAGSLGKIGADIALMAQSEVGAVTLAAGGTSSSMSHKNNPVKAELLVALAHYTAGLSGTLNHAMLHESERSGVAWTLEWLTLPALLVSTGASLRLASALLQEVVGFNETAP